MSNISLKQLEVFVTVADCGSFTEAGRKLYLSQSAVSSHISALEEALGCGTDPTGSAPQHCAYRRRKTCLSVCQGCFDPM